MLQSKKQSPKQKENPGEQHEQQFNTILGEGILFKGNFEASEPIFVHGKIQGNITSTSDVILSSTSELKGDMNAQYIEIAGEAKGKITCHGTTNITEKGMINGTLHTNRLMMSEDSVFDGNLKIQKTKTTQSDSQNSTSPNTKKPKNK